MDTARFDLEPRPVYKFETVAGAFTLIYRRGQWHAMRRGESLGASATPEGAAESLAQGLFFKNDSAPQFPGISAALADWQIAQRVQIQSHGTYLR